MGGVDLLCICDNEWCYCDNFIYLDDVDPRAHRYPPAEVACDQCKEGNHVLEDPGGSIVFRVHRSRPAGVVEPHVRPDQA